MSGCIYQEIKEKQKETLLPFRRDSVEKLQSVLITEILKSECVQICGCYFLQLKENYPEQWKQILKSLILLNHVYM